MVTPFTLAPWFALPEWTEQFECSCCGGEVQPTDAGWRWNGDMWEHRCEGVDPQCGSFEAVPKTRW